VRGKQSYGVRLAKVRLFAYGSDTIKIRVREPAITFIHVIVICVKSAEVAGRIKAGDAKPGETQNIHKTVDAFGAVTSGKQFGVRKAGARDDIYKHAVRGLMCGGVGERGVPLADARNSGIPVVSSNQPRNERPGMFGARHRHCKRGGSPIFPHR
jgi:hypothetical protein